MTGYDLYFKLSERDFSGSQSDRYAQKLGTIFSHINVKLFPLLEKAHKEGKKVRIKKESLMNDHFILNDLIIK